VAQGSAPGLARRSAQAPRGREDPADLFP
jgi:hypothetical protein